MSKNKYRNRLPQASRTAGVSPAAALADASRSVAALQGNRAERAGESQAHGQDARATSMAGTAMPLSPSRRIVLCRPAVRARFEALGGAALERCIALTDATVTAATDCRKAEAARLDEDPLALRESGERPIITVSEGRLAARDLLRYVLERNALLKQAQAEIDELIDAAAPTSEAELLAVLATLDETPDNSAQVAAAQDFTAQVSADVPPAERQEFEAAVRAGDDAALQRVVNTPPPELAELRSSLQAA